CLRRPPTCSSTWWWTCSMPWPIRGSAPDEYQRRSPGPCEAHTMIYSGLSSPPVDPPPTHAPSDAELLSRFQPVFDRIAEGAVAREQQRQLAWEPVAWLREAGFGALRIPRRYGGIGASIPQFF